MDFPGSTATLGVLRVTDDRALLRDNNGRSLAYLGRAHPVVRRACSRAQRTSGTGSDARVSVARADGNTPPSVLFTYGAELRSGQRIEMQWVIAVMLSPGRRREGDHRVRSVATAGGHQTRRAAIA